MVSGGGPGISDLVELVSVFDGAADDNSCAGEIAPLPFGRQGAAGASLQPGWYYNIYYG